jgi:lysophospholipase L1-like esterase
MKRLAVLAAVVIAVVFLGATCCPAKKPRALLVAFGDSITASEATPKYPWYIKEWLGLDDDQLVNEGESGQKLADGLPRLTKMLDCNTYENAATILFLMGGNDLIDWVQAIDPALIQSPADPGYPFAAELDATLDGIENHLAAAMDAILATGRTPIVGTYFHVLPFKSPCDLTPLGFLTPGQADRANEYSDLLNERVRAVAAARGLIVADIAQSGALYDDPDNFLNCNHPSGAGNEIVAAFFYQAILALPDYRPGAFPAP